MSPWQGETNEEHTMCNPAAGLLRPSVCINPQENDMEAENIMEARESVDGWHVVDPEGGVWWPDEKAAEDIEAAADPAAEALRMAAEEPMRGTWKC